MGAWHTEEHFLPACCTISLSESILGSQAIASLGLIAAVFSSKGIQSNSDTYKVRFIGIEIYTRVFSHCLWLGFDFKPTFP